ncbi:hypothetical protein [Phytomonospora endophytica]|uniref:Uncharacterized protein n=1 Tax=Phytomonospora endophytica TaxID=714109 RepID=A0A841FUY9_9ACTN|nr:hypothetical protein [Phytomonospora endophytica]MBB6035800.1 hypothetical protein [Phytomonospora endophytica]GIG69529.1 hypothetical protein Pen01_58240 [Phytomonospora endophytica]
MVNQPPPYDPNYGQQPPQQPAPDYGQAQQVPDYGQQQPPPQAPAYGPPPGGQLPPPAYPAPQAGFTSPPNLGGPRRPGGVAGVMALFFIMAGVTVATLILAIVEYLDFQQYTYPDDSLWSLTWFFAMALDAAKILGLILAGVMVAGGKDGARILGAFVAGAVFQNAISTVFNGGIMFFDYGHVNATSVLSFIFHLILSAAAIVTVVLCVGRPLSRWFATKVLGRTV